MLMFVVEDCDGNRYCVEADNDNEALEILAETYGQDAMRNRWGDEARILDYCDSDDEDEVDNMVDQYEIMNWLS